MLFLLIACLAGAGYLQYMIYQKYWAKKLEVTVRFADAYAWEGESSLLIEEISNRKRMAVPTLEVCFSVGRNLVFFGEARENSHISDRNYQRDIFSLFGHQRVIRRIPFACGKRGFYRITRADVVGTDFLYLHRYKAEQAQETQLYVYPRQVDTRRISLIHREITGMIMIQSRLHPDPFEFSGIREYRVSDPMHAVNWKASAKSQSLMVNQYDSTTSIRVTLVLDVEDREILRSEDLCEESIRILSSLTASLIRSGAEIHIVTNAYMISEEEAAAELETYSDSRSRSILDEKKAEGSAEKKRELLMMHMQKGAGAAAKLNQALARIDLAAESPEIGDILSESDHVPGGGGCCILISKNRRESTDRALTMLSAEGNQVLWVVPVYPGETMEQESRMNVRIVRWEVEQ